MRNLKKILALVLALVMSLSVMATAAFTDAAEIDATYDEATQVLAALKVFEGKGNNVFDPKANITREEVAAILYRIATGDVAKKQVSLYVDGAKFDDVKSTDWAAGYIGYCANGGLIGGYGDGNFGYGDPVTGYQVLAMILRAVGYGKNGEFVGANWEKNVASVAQDAQILKNLKDVQLSLPVSREVVAELLFQGIQVKQVTYTPAFGYQPSTTVLGKTLSIGEEVFALTSTETINDWGRPGTLWGFNVGTGSLFVADKPTASYVTAVTECQVAVDTAQTTQTKTYDTYTNGKVNFVDNGKTITSTEVYKTIGAQGQLTEVYAAKGIIVCIDTLLAKVTKVTANVYDAANHRMAPATIALTVYDGDAHSTNVVLSSTTDYPYTAGQYVLVNAIQNAATGYVLTDDASLKLHTITGAAENFTGAQTFVHWFADKHTVNSVEYFDNNRFHLDDAKITLGTNFTWFKDANGNLIGSAVIVTPKAYAVVEGVQWLNTWGTNGYAQANVRYMDNTTATVIVKDVDSKAMTYADYTALDLTGGDDFKNGLVSTVWQYNDDCMFDLYEVITNTDGTVSLKEQAELTKANVADGVSAVTGTAGQTTATIYTDNFTVYMIQTQNPTTKAYTYTMVTGYDNLEKSWTVSDAVEADYVLNPTEAGGYAKYVYVTGPADTVSTNAYNYAYFTSNTAYYGDAQQNGVACFVIGGTVDATGTPTVLYVAKTAGSDDPTAATAAATTKTELIALLTAAKDKLFEIKTVNGIITDLDDIVAIAIDGSEVADGYQSPVLHKAYAEYFGAGTFDTIDQNGVLKTYTSTAKTTVEKAFNTNAATTIINKGGKGSIVDLTEAVLTGKAIYVVTTANVLGSNSLYAKAIFITDTSASAIATAEHTAAVNAYMVKAEKALKDAATAAGVKGDLSAIIASVKAHIAAKTTAEIKALSDFAVSASCPEYMAAAQVAYDKLKADEAAAATKAANEAKVAAVVLPETVETNTVTVAGVKAAVEAAISVSGVTDVAQVVGTYAAPADGNSAAATVKVTLTAGSGATLATRTETITITVVNP